MSQLYYFKPWIGANYRTEENMFKCRILALGDSHYCNNPCPLENKMLCGVASSASHEKMAHCLSFTQDVIKKYIDHQGKGIGRWAATYTKFAKSLAGGKQCKKEIVDIWNSIAFYNLVQANVQDNAGESDRCLSHNGINLYEKSCPAIPAVIGELHPDVIIVWGEKAWNAFFNYFHDSSNMNCLTNYEKPLMNVLQSRGTRKSVPIAIKIPHPRNSNYDKTEILFEGLLC